MEFRGDGPQLVGCDGEGNAARQVNRALREAPAWSGGEPLSASRASLAPRADRTHWPDPFNSGSHTLVTEPDGSGLGRRKSDLSPGPAGNREPRTEGTRRDGPERRADAGRDRGGIAAPKLRG